MTSEIYFDDILRIPCSRDRVFPARNVNPRESFTSASKTVTKLRYWFQLHFRKIDFSEKKRLSSGKMDEDIPSISCFS